MNKIDARIIEQLKSTNKMSPGLVKTLEKDEGRADAIVRVRNPLQLGLLERNFDVAASYPFIRSVGIKCGLNDAIRLARMSEVECVSAQSKVCTLGEDAIENTVNAETSGKDTNNDNNQNPICKKSNVSVDFWQSNRMYYPIPTFDENLDGRGVTLCVMDTGVSPHLDLSVPRNRIIGAKDFVNNEKFAYDDNGHGTFVAGVACGNGTLSAKKIGGVAPMANILSVKVIEKSGESGTFKILDGMQWLFDNFRQYGVRVVCMSFGAEPLEYADPLKIGAEMLSRSGLIVVAASGNSGENTLKSPAISNEVIAVGAVDRQNNIAKFSSRGSYNGINRPDVYSLGTNVSGLQASGTYSSMSGTSVAAPYVAGACCLLCQKYGKITPFQAKNAILNASIDVNGTKIFKI